MVKLAPGDEPGRLVEDGAGGVHIALRGGHAVVALDPKTWTITTRRPVCAAPRGIAYPPGKERLHVACAGGELVSLQVKIGPPVRVLHLERHLRDVIVAGDLLQVSRFRSGELLTLDATGAVILRRSPPSSSDPEIRNGSTFSPALAWRAVAIQGGVAMVHQRGMVTDVEPSPGGYGGGGGGGKQCDSSIVHTAVTQFPSGMTADDGAAFPRAVVPLDLAIAPSGKSYVVLAAGNAHNDALPKLFVGDFSSFGCAPDSNVLDGAAFASPSGQPIAVAFDGSGHVVVQSREPATIQVLYKPPITVTIAPSNLSREDTGHSLFHANSGANIACATCHGEGGDDGRGWNLSGVGPRRTPSLRGGVMARTPFHWEGDLTDLPALLADVYVGRMGGPIPTEPEAAALASWLDRIPLLGNSPPANPFAVTRGDKAFHDLAGAACAACHGGPQFTGRAMVDVGTGGKLKVPSLLGVGARAPFLHDGRAETLKDRFGPDGGGDQHGKTSNLTDAAIADLVAYLETLRSLPPLAFLVPARRSPIIPPCASSAPCPSSRWSSPGAPGAGCSPTGAASPWGASTRGSCGAGGRCLRAARATRCPSYGRSAAPATAPTSWPARSPTPRAGSAASTRVARSGSGISRPRAAATRSCIARTRTAATRT
ncbi:MAG: c-type cytochrome [Myxococcales bacterium]|nr:c-type cytochrome [Myxococcales bacterium]